MQMVYKELDIFVSAYSGLNIGCGCNSKRLSKKLEPPKPTYEIMIGTLETPQVQYKVA